MKKFLGGSALVLLAAVQFAGAAPQYLVTDLGTLPGDNISGTRPNAINGKGQITGVSGIDNANSIFHAFLYSNGTMTDLGTLGGKGSEGLGINDAGQVVGYSYNYNQNSTPIGFFTAGGFIGGTGTLGGSYSFAYGINTAGQITGYAATSNDVTNHAFLRQKDGSTIDFTAPFFNSGSSSSAYAVNSAGYLVGQAYTAGDAHLHAFFSNGALGVDLTPNLADESSAYALNNISPSTLIVGSTGVMDTANEKAALFPGSTATLLGELTPGGKSRALGVNDAGTIVGFAAAGSGNHAFIYRSQDASPAMIDLNSLIAPGGNVTLTSATGINASGQICATGRDSSLTPNYDRAFLLTPLITPTVKISGPKSLKTKKPTLLVRGTATGTIASVTYAVGTTKGKASGTTAWKFTAKLKRGKNVITVLANGAAGSSTPAKITITRK